MAIDQAIGITEAQRRTVLALLERHLPGTTGLGLRLAGEEGYDVRVPRAAIRKGVEVDYIDESGCKAQLDALDKRNLLSHTYRSDVARDAETLIKERYHPVLLRLHRTPDAKRKP